MRSLALATLLLTACTDPSTNAPVVEDASVPVVPDSGSVVVDAGQSIDAGSEDAGVADAGTPPDAGPAAPRCSVSVNAVQCAFQKVAFTAGSDTRDVYFETPSTPAPANGYPVVIIFQGAYFAPSASWGTVPANSLYGGYYQAKLQARLLDHGFMVVAPSALSGVAWQTNTGLAWDATADKPFMDALLAAIARGDFGPSDSTHRYATGISSGGYMTSRMALSYAGQFRALAIQSGSWATCAASLCVVPSTMPTGHPPTLFLHGGLDFTVPLWTAQAYQTQLATSGFVSDIVIDNQAAHEWLSVAPERVTAWFEAH
jgi:poly(3-hydroxybutyrate) depolymerase